MKKSIVSMVAAIFFACLFSGVAGATPIFTGDIVAGFGSGDTGLPTDPQGPGYYIWANDDARTSWSVRWTGRDWTEDDSSATYYWSGNIYFSNTEGIENATKILWDSDGTLTVDNSQIGHDMITFGRASAGPHWDGFDFTISGEYGDYLTFMLDSTFFTTENDGIYLGQDMVSVIDFCDSPADFRSATGLSRQFEVSAPVPEPTTLLLLGSGLVGLAAYRRRK